MSRAPRRAGLLLTGCLLVGCRAAPPVAHEAPSAVEASAAPAASADTGGQTDEAPVSRTEAGAAPSWPDVDDPWCGEGFRGLDAGVCYFVPQRLAEPAVLLVYLAGIMPPRPGSAVQLEMQRVVAAAAERAGAVVLLPRGRVGLAPASTPGWWGWPTSVVQSRRHAPGMTEQWVAARARLEAVRAAPFDKMYVAGSSSGAYFVTLLALDGVLQADGFAATSGGSMPRGVASDSVRSAPFYVGVGRADSARGGARALAQGLEKAGWPVRFAEHPGGHGAREIYLDEAFAFWGAHGRDPGAPP